MAISTTLKKILSRWNKSQSRLSWLGGSSGGKLGPEPECVGAECPEPDRETPPWDTPKPNVLAGVDEVELARRRAQSAADKQRHRDKLRKAKAPPPKPKPKPKPQPKPEVRFEDQPLCTSHICDCCGRPAIKMTGDMIYENRDDLYDVVFWVCEPCDARVGTHKYSEAPLGSMATARTRAARMEAHEAFDLLWRYGGKMSRSEAYKWMRDTLGFPEDREIGIGFLNESECKTLIESVHKHIQAK